MPGAPRWLFNQRYAAARERAGSDARGPLSRLDRGPSTVRKF
jgi:hypothetical protein